MAANLTLIFVAETRNVVALATRTAITGEFEAYSGLSDEEKKALHTKELEALIGDALPMANSLRPSYPQVDLSIPKGELDVVLSEPDASAMMAPLTFSLDAEGKPVSLGGTISTVVLQPGRGSVKVNVSPPVTGTAKVWMRIQPANPSNVAQTVKGVLSSAIDGGNSVTLPVSTLPAGDFVVLVLAEKYPPRFEKL